MKAGTKLVALQLVWLDGAAHDNGTDFVVAEKPKPGAKPAEVDATTAAAWIRQGWAEEPSAKAKA